MELGVRLIVVPTEGEAEVICGLLRANGISCAHRGVELAKQPFGGWWHEVLVAEGDLAAARELVEPSDETSPGAKGNLSALSRRRHLPSSMVRTAEAQR